MRPERRSRWERRLEPIPTARGTTGNAAALVSLGMADMLRIEMAANPVAGIVLPFDPSGSFFLAFYAALRLLGLVAILALRITTSPPIGDRRPEPHST